MAWIFRVNLHVTVDNPDYRDKLIEILKTTVKGFLEATGADKITYTDAILSYDAYERDTDGVGFGEETKVG